MSNVTALPAGDPVRRARADFINEKIEEDDRSIRYVAGRIGLNHNSLNDRLKGKMPFTGEEIENIAYVLKRDPVKFYGEYLAAKGESEGGQDSNPHLKARPGTPGEQKDSQITKGSLATVTRLQPRTPAFERATLAPVTHIGA